MKNVKHHILVISLLLFSTPLYAQEEDKKWWIRGYIKDLVSINLADDSTNVDNLIHNRLNFKWFPTDHLNVHVEMRNRLFWGETIKQIPEYGRFIDTNNDYFDMSIMSEKNSVLFHSMIDRAFVEWYNQKWEVRVGRQRINWGVHVVWNPNDLFNAYSFFDFDYGERPGSDAIRIKRYTGVASSLELASNVADDFDDIVIAGLWKWNKWNYDFQLLVGKAQEDITLGMGWAGNIKTAGFKGEVTYFVPYTSASKSLLATIMTDYSFQSSLYLAGAVLFNSGSSANPDFQQSVNLFNQERLTAKTLSPFRYATFLQMSYSVHPLVSVSSSIIYYPNNRDPLFINPGVSYSVKSNFDIDLISQLYFDRFLDNYRAQAKLIFLRVKWSF